MLLQHLTVLLVGPDTLAIERVAEHLRAEKALVHVRHTRSQAVALAERAAPDVLVADLALPNGDAPGLLADLRRLPRRGGLPGVALCEPDHGIGLVSAPAERFEKYLAKPARPSDVTDAICCVAGDRTIPHPGTSVSIDELGDGLLVHDYRWLLGALNAATPYRYTALLRFEQDTLASIWTFDRNHPTHDPFLPGIPIAETPCAEVRRTRSLVVIDDAGDEAAVPTLPTHRMRSFAGVPLDAEAESPPGALCHFDHRPRAADRRAIEYLERAASLIRVGRTGRGNA
jgi:CheY-like chemotaxis protein